MNYFEVKAKCGHVRRTNYIVKKFYIKAEDGEAAAKKVRNKPRVKHHKKDAIIEVRKICKEEYLLGLKNNKDDMYFKVHSKQEQIICGAVNECEIFKEEIDDVKYKKTYIGRHLKFEILEKEWKKNQNRGRLND